MQALLNSDVYVAFHPCWRATPRYNCCNISLLRAASAPWERRAILQLHDATAYKTTRWAVIRRNTPVVCVPSGSAASAASAGVP